MRCKQNGLVDNGTTPSKDLCNDIYMSPSKEEEHIVGRVNYDIRQERKIKYGPIAGKSKDGQRKKQ